MFQERMPVREKETRETQIRSEGLDFEEHFQALEEIKEREDRMVVNLTNVFKKGGQSYV